jgi:hypothetical protein
MNQPPGGPYQQPPGGPYQPPGGPYQPPPGGPYQQPTGGPYQPPPPGGPYQPPPGGQYQPPPGQDPPYVGFPADPGYGGLPPTGAPQGPYGPQYPYGAPPPRKTHWVRNILIGVGALVVFVLFVAVLVAALAHPKSAKSGSSATGHHSASSSGGTSHGGLTANIGGGFKVTSINGAVYDVTLTKVVDPAHGSGFFNAPSSGDHLVAAVFHITGVSGRSSDDSNLDASLTGSNGQVYDPVFNAVAGYTNFNAGEFDVTAGQSETGAVTFQIPNGIKVRNIEWTVGITGNTGTWNVG